MFPLTVMGSALLLHCRLPSIVLLPTTELAPLLLICTLPLTLLEVKVHGPELLLQVKLPPIWVVSTATAAVQF